MRGVVNQKNSRLIRRSDRLPLRQAISCPKGAREAKEGRKADDGYQVGAPTKSHGRQLAKSDGDCILGDVGDCRVFDRRRALLLPRTRSVTYCYPETPRVRAQASAIAAAAGTSSKLQTSKYSYAVVTALLLSTQEPFSFLAAKRLGVTQFVFLTQVALLMSIPLLIGRTTSRRDLMLLLTNTDNSGKLGVLLGVGMIGLLMFKLGLSNAHPVIISAIMDLLPFWAAVVALLIARVPIPVSPAIFFGCLVAAFLGASAASILARAGSHERWAAFGARFFQRRRDGLSVFDCDD